MRKRETSRSFRDRMSCRRIALRGLEIEYGAHPKIDVLADEMTTSTLAQDMYSADSTEISSLTNDSYEPGLDEDWSDLPKYFTKQLQEITLQALWGQMKVRFADQDLVHELEQESGEEHRLAQRMRFSAENTVIDCEHNEGDPSLRWYTEEDVEIMEEDYKQEVLLEDFITERMTLRK